MIPKRKINLLFAHNHPFSVSYVFITIIKKHDRFNKIQNHQRKWSNQQKCKLSWTMIKLTLKPTFYRWLNKSVFLLFSGTLKFFPLSLFIIFKPSSFSITLKKKLSIQSLWSNTSLKTFEKTVLGENFTMESVNSMKIWSETSLSQVQLTGHNLSQLLQFISWFQQIGKLL